MISILNTCLLFKYSLLSGDTDLATGSSNRSTTTDSHSKLLQINGTANSTANDASNEVEETSLPITLLIRLVAIKWLVVLEANAYHIQLLFYVLFGYFQAELNYSIRLLFIERFANKKLCMVLSLHRFLVGLGQLVQLTVRSAFNYLNVNQLKGLISTSICRSADCGILVSNFIIILICSLAIILLHFISNRSINRFGKRTKVVNKSGSSLFSLFDKFKVFTKFFRIFRVFRTFRISRIVQCFKSNRLTKRKSDPKSKATDCPSDENRFKYKKQLSDSNLKDITRKGGSAFGRLNRYNSDLMLLRSVEDTILDFKDFIDLTSNYLIDCILCGKSYIVYLDLEKIQLVELCSVDDLEIDRLDEHPKDNKTDATIKKDANHPDDRYDEINKMDKKKVKKANEKF